MELTPETRLALETAYTIQNQAGKVWFRGTHLPKSYMRRVEYDNALTTFEKLQAQIRNDFAAGRGWRIASRPVSGEYPCMDHVEQFYAPGHRLAAALSHSYANLEQLESYARANNYELELLPWSWYYPGGAIAALFKVKEVAT